MQPPECFIPIPTPRAQAISLSLGQRTVLEEIVRQTTNAYRLVRRARLVLGAADGVSNSALSKQLSLSRNQVQLWRSRWQAATWQSHLAGSFRGSQNLIKLLSYFRQPALVASR